MSSSLTHDTQSSFTVRTQSVLTPLCSDKPPSDSGQWTLVQRKPKKKQRVFRQFYSDTKLEQPDVISDSDHDSEYDYRKRPNTKKSWMKNYPFGESGRKLHEKRKRIRIIRENYCGQNQEGDNFSDVELEGWDADPSTRVRRQFGCPYTKDVIGSIRRMTGMGRFRYVRNVSRDKDKGAQSKPMHRYASRKTRAIEICRRIKNTSDVAYL